MLSLWGFVLEVDTAPGSQATEVRGRGSCFLFNARQIQEALFQVLSAAETLRTRVLRWN